MSGGGSDWAQHLPWLEKYFPREKLLAFLPNVSQENLDFFMSLMKNDSGGDMGSLPALPTSPDHAACDVGFRDGYKVSDEEEFDVAVVAWRLWRA